MRAASERSHSLPAVVSHIDCATDPESTRRQVSVSHVESGRIASAGTICAKLFVNRVSTVQTTPWPGSTRNRPDDTLLLPSRPPIPWPINVISPRLPIMCAGIVKRVVDALPARVSRDERPSCNTNTVRSSRKRLSSVTGIVYVSATGGGAGSPDGLNGMQAANVIRVATRATDISCGSLDEQDDGTTVGSAFTTRSSDEITA